MLAVWQHGIGRRLSPKLRHAVVTQWQTTCENDLIFTDERINNMYQNLDIIGNLGRDPELKFTADGKAVASFSVAVSRKLKDAEETAWFRVSVWDKQAEACNQYLRKGSKVFVSGRLACDKATGGPRVYQRDDGTWASSFEVVANRVLFLSSKQDAKPADEFVPF